VLPPEVIRALEHAALCNDATLVREETRFTITGDPTEGALVVAAEKAGVRVEALRAERARVDTIPFESEHRFMVTLHAGPASPNLLVLKGAPEAVLGRLSGLSEERLGQLRTDVERMAGSGAALARARCRGRAQPCPALRDRVATRRGSHTPTHNPRRR
jgi:magnesium-transporting ATPase (P-type)